MSSLGLIAVTTIALSHSSFQVLDKDVHSPLARAMQGGFIIAQQYGEDDPHGKDPHGKDPYTEQHELAMPANTGDKNQRATDDVYGGAAGNNTKAPYNGSN